jgi:hypothetical protein
MNHHRILLAILFVTLVPVSACGFVEAVFKTGVGVGVFIVVAILVAILMISRRGRRGV